MYLRKFRPMAYLLTPQFVRHCKVLNFPGHDSKAQSIMSVSCDVVLLRNDCLPSIDKTKCGSDSEVTLGVVSRKPNVRPPFRRKLACTGTRTPEIPAKWEIPKTPISGFLSVPIFAKCVRILSSLRQIFKKIGLDWSQQKYHNVPRNAALQRIFIQF